MEDENVSKICQNVSETYNSKEVFNYGYDENFVGEDEDQSKLAKIIEQ